MSSSQPTSPLTGLTQGERGDCPRLPNGPEGCAAQEGTVPLLTGTAPGVRLEEAFATYRRELLGTLYFMLGNVDDAQDVLQEAFIKCWRNRSQVSEVGNLRAWIFRVVVNAARDLRRNAWRRHTVPISGVQHVSATQQEQPADDLDRREQLDLVRRALVDLRPEEREVFLLRQNGDMTYEEIARNTGNPVGTVKTRMRLALSKLRVALR